MLVVVLSLRLSEADQTQMYLLPNLCLQVDLFEVVLVDHHRKVLIGRPILELQVVVVVEVGPMMLLVEFEHLQIIHLLFELVVALKVLLLLAEAELLQTIQLVFVG